MNLKAEKLSLGEQVMAPRLNRPLRIGIVDDRSGSWRDFRAPKAERANIGIHLNLQILSMVSSILRPLYHVDEYT
jgi:hypothetical protein